MAKAKRTTKRETALKNDTLEGGRDRASLPRPTATAARRRRPTSKPTEAGKPAERRVTAREQRAGATPATGRGSKGGTAAKQRALREDKREAPSEVVTDAAPTNLNADRNDKKSKGKSTHSIEAHAPGTRPSRKSSRRGANHIKPDAQQRRQVTRAARSPERRHAERSG